MKVVRTYRFSVCAPWYQCASESCVLYDPELYGFARFSPHTNLQDVSQCYVALSSGGLGLAL